MWTAMTMDPGSAALRLRAGLRPGNAIQRLFRATTYSISAHSLSKPLTSPAGAGVSRAQPVRRGIIVVAIERIAPVFLARLEAGVEMAARLQRTPYQRQHLRQLGPRDVKQAGVGPDAVIGFDHVEVVEQQRLDRPTETARCLGCQLRRAVGGTNIKTRGPPLRGIAAG